MTKCNKLTDRVAIVTGGGQGVGLGVARAFAAEGGTVVVANRSAEKGEAAVCAIEADFKAAGARALYIKTDVSDKDSVLAMVAQTVAEFGRVDILVNNATPTGGTSRLENMSDDAMRAESSRRFSFSSRSATFSRRARSRRAPGAGHPRQARR